MSDVAPTDKALWQAALTGDAVGFAKVYERYAQRLFTYAYRHTGSTQCAEDALSLVMLEAWRRRADVRFGTGETMAGWLFLTARYVLANDARAARRHRRALARIAQLASPCTEDLDQQLLDDERLRDTLEILAGLPARDREILELAAWSGLSEPDIAAALGIPVGTVKSRLSRARRRLAERCDVQSKPLAVFRFAINSEDLR